jgi:hypothetical protein
VHFAASCARCLPLRERVANTLPTTKSLPSQHFRQPMSSGCHFATHTRDEGQAIHSAKGCLILHQVCQRSFFCYQHCKLRLLIRTIGRLCSEQPVEKDFRLLIEKWRPGAPARERAPARGVTRSRRLEGRAADRPGFGGRMMTASVAHSPEDKTRSERSEG